MRPGQDLVIGGFIGIEGTVYAAGRMEERLRKTLPQELLDAAKGFRNYLKDSPEAAVSHLKSGISMQAVGEGGVFAALWDMAKEHGAGFVIDLKRIPVRQETIEICEALELNPYELMSGGCTLFAADNGNDLLWVWNEAGISGAVIGKVTEGRACVIRNGENLRYLNRPEPDEIKKLEDMLK